ncbi:MAG: alpha/beta fold hydrolase [Betaproteobacteria bacterium]|nr:alpha/beta fold hydrolase [Betaproteobacteria bacterium]
MFESQRVHSGVDKFRLCAHLSVPINSEARDAVALINAGAGIDSRYYERFASYLAEAGIPTLVYDYRGIGRSRPQSMRGFEASVEEWGSKDCAAVLDWLAERFPGARRIVIGHSVGGFLTGFARNGHLIDHMVLVGAHTGYWGDYAPYAAPGCTCCGTLSCPLLHVWSAIFPGDGCICSKIFRAEWRWNGRRGASPISGGTYGGPTDSPMSPASMRSSGAFAPSTPRCWHCASKTIRSPPWRRRSACWGFIRAARPSSGW